MKSIVVLTLAACAVVFPSGAMAESDKHLNNTPPASDPAVLVEVGLLHKKSDEEYIKDLKERDEKIAKLETKITALEKYKSDRDGAITEIIGSLIDEASSIEAEYKAVKRKQLKDTARVDIAKMDLRAFQLGLQEKVDGAIDQDSLDGDYGTHTAKAVEIFQNNFHSQSYSGRYDSFRKIYAWDITDKKEHLGNKDGDGWLKPDEARTLICDAAIGGEPLAMFFLSQMFKEGFGFVQSDDKALYTALEAIRGLDARIANRDSRNKDIIKDSKRLKTVMLQWINKDLGGDRDSRRFTDANLCNNEQFVAPKRREFKEIKLQLKELEKVRDRLVVIPEVEKE